jgi:hypothetical protein
MRPSNVIHAASFNQLPILASEARGCHGEILDKLHRLFEHMLNTHNKVFFMRFDVRYPDGYPCPLDNTIFCDFIANFIKNRKREGLDPVYLWVREQPSNECPHFHCVALLNGNRTQSVYGHLEVAEYLWARALGITDGRGLICHCQPDPNSGRRQNGIMLKRESPDFQSVLDEAFRWSSYLSKTSTKGMGPNNVREFGASELPPGI